MERYKTNKVLMVRPVAFGFNEETAVNNHYQKKGNLSSYEIQEKALFEFDEMVSKLKNIGIDVKILQDTKTPHTPDSIFPNNWFSTHSDNTVILYPMFAKNRRLERREDLYDIFENINEIKTLDYSQLENEGVFLEGTGSLVLDRKNKKAYCSLSERADERLLNIFCDDMGYKKIDFRSYQTVDTKRKLIYHTNVMMSIAENYAILCADAIDNKEERQKVIDELKASKKEIVYISEEQVENFLGNAIELKNKDGVSILVMSSTAYNILTEKQKNIIEKYSVILPADVKTIEKYGGGSARCMIAELFI
ncbi:citrulline utilization hydrolase CtlX [Fusobacterium gastrosuis]|uniref:citrulline utilization hydrolase CtlX n=1 Tax=Fusobacterium gastrosuis TaxID=1755100 RepID=UPI00297046A5|nr:arginine deiminase-related protein [Fusobacteriaceae bacterium]MDY5713767.1 arginine deiminase-related protein [Fusobacterium gastrosuis]